MEHQQIFPTNIFLLDHFIPMSTESERSVLYEMKNYINDLWQKNKDLQETIKNQGSYIARLRVKLHRIEMSEDAQEEKKLAYMTGRSQDLDGSSRDTDRDPDLQSRIPHPV